MDIFRRLVFVCTGNTCRSPMAAALARREAEKRRLSVEIESCGTGARPGDRATREAVAACAEAGLDISHHSATNISDVLDSEDTLYVVMSIQHASWLRFVLSIPGERVFVLGDGIPDPFGGSLEVYRNTFKYLENVIRLFFDRIEINLAALSDDDAARAESVFEFEIMKAEGEHAPAISMLENRTFTDSWSLSLLSDEIDNADAIFLIASDKTNGVPVTDKKSQPVYGYAIALITADIAQLLKLSVDEHVRRQGVAEALLAALIKKAAERGCTEITLEARVSNAPAIALYEKAGFESLGVRPNFYSDPKEDALIMSRSIEPVKPGTGTAAEVSGSTPENLSGETGDVPEDIPGETGDASEDIPGEAGDVPEDIPGEAGDASEDVPDEAGDASEDVPGEAGDASEDVPDEAGDASEDVPDEAGDMILLMPDDEEDIPDNNADTSGGITTSVSSVTDDNGSGVSDEPGGTAADIPDDEFDEENDMILLMPDDDE